VRVLSRTGKIKVERERVNKTKRVWIEESQKERGKARMGLRELARAQKQKREREK